MATTVRDNIYLLETQAEYIAELVKQGINKQWFYRKAIEAALEKHRTEEKKIANFQG